MSLLLTQFTVAITVAVQDAIQAASDSLGMEPEVVQESGAVLDDLVSGDIDVLQSRFAGYWDRFISTMLPGLLKALVLFIVLYLMFRVVRSILGKILRRSKKVDSGLESLLMKTFSMLAWVLIVIMVLDQFGIDVTALLAGLSIIGLAVSFAAKDSLENFISGITILIDRPFRGGDQIVVDGTYGTVEEITLRSTRLRTLNNEMMVMPNMLMINQKVINHSLLGILRVEVQFGIAYKESTQAARAVILNLVKGDQRISSQYVPQVVVTGLGDSSVDMVLRFYIADSSLEVPMQAEYYEKVFVALKGAGIEIPFPHLQLFIDEAKGLLPPSQVGSPVAPRPPDWNPM